MLSVVSIWVLNLAPRPVGLPSRTLDIITQALILRAWPFDSSSSHSACLAIGYSIDLALGWLGRPIWAWVALCTRTIQPYSSHSGLGIAPHSLDTKPVSGLLNCTKTTRSSWQISLSCFFVISYLDYSLGVVTPATILKKLKLSNRYLVHIYLISFV